MGRLGLRSEFCRTFSFYRQSRKGWFDKAFHKGSSQESTNRKVFHVPVLQVFRGLCIQKFQKGRKFWSCLLRFWIWTFRNQQVSSIRLCWWGCFRVSNWVRQKITLGRWCFASANIPVPTPIVRHRGIFWIRMISTCLHWMSGLSEDECRGLLLDSIPRQNRSEFSFGRLGAFWQ